LDGADDLLSCRRERRDGKGGQPQKKLNATGIGLLSKHQNKSGKKTHRAMLGKKVATTSQNRNIHAI